VIYLDTSALVKLVIEEAESETLEHWLLLRDEPVVTSVIGRVELLRACRRIDPASTASASLLLADLPLIPLAGRVLETAENIGPRRRAASTPYTWPPPSTGAAP
jgi:predicted nucleic acid-binding protein